MRVTEEQAAPEEPELRNTLYRRLTRGQRRLTRARLLVYRVGYSNALPVGDDGGPVQSD